MNSLSKSDLDKTFIHPEDNKQFVIKEIKGTYAWHGSHHIEHITELKKKNGW
ncbi:hypothetical protein [Flavobacterium sp. W20_MBD1_R3]|uniref:hypothetical protein n=1 Tax=Flavobacterium sp. W20_MBD1_R3 TaxID=3240278 RepID=UPI003F8E3CBB